MTSVRSTQRYTAVAIALHWLIALGIIAMIFFGWYMGDVEDRMQRFALIQLHKSVGITILVLTVARILWRLMNPAPPEPPMPGWQAAAARAVHLGFYALMILLPLSGWIMVSASPTGIGTQLFKLVEWPHLPVLADLPRETKQDLHDPLEFVHSKLAWVVLALLALHVGAALKHQFLDRDRLLARMAPGLLGPTNGPPRRPRGVVPAFGGAALFFGLIAGYALLDGRSPPLALPASASPAPDGASAPAWTVDPAQSAIRFSGAYMGRPFAGRFEQWTANIRFDPDRPEAARIRVAIPTGGAKTGETYYDENLPEGDWFNVAEHPEAVFEVNEGVLKTGDNSYEATGILVLKGERFPLRLPFKLDIAGTEARMRAEITMQRTALGIGRETLTAPKGDEEWVADDVRLQVEVVARRQ